MRRIRLLIIELILLVIVVTLACRQPTQSIIVPTIIYHPFIVTATPSPAPSPTAEPASTGSNVSYVPVIPTQEELIVISPTPDAPRELPEVRTAEEHYIVQAGDSLGKIASRYGVSVQMLLNANTIYYPDYLEVGQELVIPAPNPGQAGSSVKIVPDSGLVYGPDAQSFDIQAFVNNYDSYLNKYTEDVEGQVRTGPQIVDLVAHDYSVNPKLLLAILEYQSEWVTQANPPEDTTIYPIGIRELWREGLYQQLSWAANALNRGFYLWRVGGIGAWLLSSGESVPVDPTINAGTAGVQQVFALLDDRTAWDAATSENGLLATYGHFFGNPFDDAVEPLIPPDLQQPPMQLPFEDGVDWAFTGGPHGGWADGSAWAALDFAPGYNGLGCLESYLWVVAVADGLIVRADEGRVIQDLDGDGNEGTGWVVLYMHIAGDERVQAGTYVKAGERIGHPSCTGGYSTGTHVHLARRYNGEWIPADQPQFAPFDLDGWISSGNGIEYDGYLERDGESVTAWEGYFPGNAIHR